MSRQLDIKKELRETAKRDALVKALDYGIAGAIEAQGMELQGIAIKYDAFNCLITVKARAADEYHVAFVGSDTVINCILKLYGDARREGLKWRPDKFRK